MDFFGGWEDGVYGTVWVLWSGKMDGWMDGCTEPERRIGGVQFAA